MLSRRWATPALGLVLGNNSIEYYDPWDLSASPVCLHTVSSYYGYARRYVYRFGRVGGAGSYQPGFGWRAARARTCRVNTTLCKHNVVMFPPYGSAWRR